MDMASYWEACMSYQLELEGYGHEESARDILKVKYKVCTYFFSTRSLMQLEELKTTSSTRAIRAHVELVHCNNKFLASSRYKTRCRPVK